MHKYNPLRREYLINRVFQYIVCYGLSFEIFYKSNISIHLMLRFKCAAKV
nr:MAG TPA: hypothetical protein [Caudoviricetes sp.]